MDYLHLLVTRYPQLEPCRAAVAAAFDVLCRTYNQDRTFLPTWYTLSSCSAMAGRATV